MHPFSSFRGLPALDDEMVEGPQKKADADAATKRTIKPTDTEGISFTVLRNKSHYTAEGRYENVKKL